MIDNQLLPASSSAYESTSNAASTEDFDEVTASEISALREARKRALEARLDAERLLREAEHAEAQLVAREEQAVSTAIAARAERAVSAVRIATENERAAIDRVAAVDSELERCLQSRQRIETAAVSVAQSRDEAQRALDRLTASLADFEDQLRETDTNVRHLELELASSRRSVEDLKHFREQAEAVLGACTPGPLLLTVEVKPPLELAPPLEHQPPVAEVLFVSASAASSDDPFDVAAQRAQRAAERRAADAARALMS